MKKFIILVIIALFTLTSCTTNSKQEKIDSKRLVTIQNEQFNLKSEAELSDLKYRENYVDFYSDAIGNIRTMSYTKEGNLIFEVRLMYDENRTESELKAIIETNNNIKETTKEIRKLKYIYYEYSENGLTVHHYIHTHNNKVYSIAFYLGKTPTNIEEVFMNNVSFK